MDDDISVVLFLSITDVQVMIDVHNRSVFPFSGALKLGPETALIERDHVNWRLEDGEKVARYNVACITTMRVVGTKR